MKKVESESSPMSPCPGDGRPLRRNLFIFVLWQKARRFETEILAKLRDEFTILHEEEMFWPRLLFTRRLHDFYGFGSRFLWWNKGRKVGRGPFLTVLVEDERPVWRRCKDTRGRVVVADAHVHWTKESIRRLTGHSNNVHSSVTLEETDMNVRCLFGCAPEELAARRCLPSALEIERLKTTGAPNHTAQRQTPPAFVCCCPSPSVFDIIPGNEKRVLWHGQGFCRMERKGVAYTAEEIDVLLGSGALKRLGMGSRRACYGLPDGKSCLKCYRSDVEIEEGRYPGAMPPRPLAARAIRDIRRYRFDEKRNTCCQEYRYWLSLKQRLPADLMSVFPSAMELIFLPSRGWAVVEELVANADGTPPRKFAEVWRAFSDGSASVRATRDSLGAGFLVLADAVMRHAIRFYDPQNILVQNLPDDSCRLRITDFEPGSRMLVPIDAIPAFMCLKVRRRFMRYMRTLGIASQEVKYE